MGTLLALLVIVQTVLTSVFSQQMADEFKAWTPWLTRQLIDRSVLKLPPELQERYREEWFGHVQEIPGQIGKLLVAAGFLTAARGIRLSYTVPDLSPSPASNSFGLLPEPEGRWGSFGVSLVTNLTVLILLVSLIAAVHRVPRPHSISGAAKGSQSTPAK